MTSELVNCSSITLQTLNFNHNSHNSSVNIFTTVKFTANETMPLSIVTPKLTECVTAVEKKLKNHDSRLTVVGANDTYFEAQFANLVWNISCCGKKRSPPCCYHPSSEKLNESSCGK